MCDFVRQNLSDIHVCSTIMLCLRSSMSQTLQKASAWVTPSFGDLASFDNTPVSHKRKRGTGLSNLISNARNSTVTGEIKLSSSELWTTKYAPTNLVMMLTSQNRNSTKNTQYVNLPMPNLLQSSGM